MSEGGTLAEIRERGRLRVGGRREHARLLLPQPETGDIEGFEVDLATRSPPASSATTRRPGRAGAGGDRREVDVVEDGRVDMTISANSMTCARWEEVAFSTEYYTAHQQFLVREDSPIRSVDDLAGKTVCVTSGSSSIGLLAEHVPEAELHLVPDRTGCLLALQEGEVDAYFGHDSFLYGMCSRTRPSRSATCCPPEDTRVALRHRHRPRPPRARPLRQRRARGDPRRRHVGRAARASWRRSSASPPADPPRPSTGTDMDTDLDSSGCRDAVARTGATLLALEQDPTVQLLDASTLSGETAADGPRRRRRGPRCSGPTASSATWSSGRPSARPGEVAPLLRGPSVVVPTCHAAGRAGPARWVAARRAGHARPAPGRHGRPSPTSAPSSPRSRRSGREAIPWVGDATRSRWPASPATCPTGLAEALDARGRGGAGRPARLVVERRRGDRRPPGQRQATSWPRCGGARRLAGPARRRPSAPPALDAAVAARRRRRWPGRRAASPASPLADRRSVPGLAAELDALAESAGTASWPDVAAELAAWRRARRPLAERAGRRRRAPGAARHATSCAAGSTRTRPRRPAAAASRTPSWRRSVAGPTTRCTPRRPTSSAARAGAPTTRKRSAGGPRRDRRRTLPPRRVHRDDRGRLLRRLRAGPGAIGRSPTPGQRCGRTGRCTTRARREPAARRRSAAGRLGAGMVDIPPVPARDPATAVMTDPTVAEHRRFCSRCDEPVGRSRDGQPGRTEGFCAACGTPFSFLASLAPGRARRRAVRGRRVPRPRRARLDLPRPRPLRVRTLGRAQGPAQQPRRARHGRRRSPSGGSSPRSSTRTSSRSTTSSSTTATATS